MAKWDKSLVSLGKTFIPPCNSLGSWACPPLVVVTTAMAGPESFEGIPSATLESLKVPKIRRIAITMALNSWHTYIVSLLHMQLRVDASGSGPTVASARIAQQWICERNIAEMRLEPGALASLGLAAGTQCCQIPLSVGLYASQTEA